MTDAWGPPKIMLDALDAVPALEEPATLRECARMVGRGLGIAMVLPDSNRRRTYLSSLLMEALEHPNGVQVLGSVVCALEGETRYTERVRTAVALAEVPLFPPRVWARLMPLLSGLEVLDVDGAYREAMRFRADPLPAHCTEPWLAVLYAATLNARPGEPLPCVLLVEHLARFAKGRHQQKLLDWVAEHGTRPEAYPGRPAASGTPAAPLAAGAESGPLPPGFCATPTPTPPIPLQAVAESPVWAPGACLLIRLRPLPDPDRGSERLLSYWWQIRGGPEPYPVRGGDLRVDLGDLPEHVKSLVQEAETGWAYFCKEDLTLEFLLPRELLNLPVEHWTKEGFHGADSTLGEDHPVVLRSLERLERTDTHGRWARRWDSLVTGGGGSVHWFPYDGRSRLLTHPQPVMAVLSGPPVDREGVHSGLDELAEALRAGVPIVVWDRRGGIDGKFRSELAELTARQGIHRLPDAVRSLRIEARDGDAAEGGPSALGRHAALLWDDPYRLPGGRKDVAEVSAQEGG